MMIVDDDDEEEEDDGGGGGGSGGGGGGDEDDDNDDSDDGELAGCSMTRRSAIARAPCRAIAYTDTAINRQHFCYYHKRVDLDDSRCLRLVNVHNQPLGQLDLNGTKYSG